MTCLAKVTDLIFKQFCLSVLFLLLLLFENYLYQTLLILVMLL